MITTLHIKNIGIIEDLTIDLNKGLNVLTGETGAGKTLIIDSLQIISGGRFSKDMIRRGENNSFVELCMYDPKNEKSEDGNIIVSREINLNGKNMCKINGRMVTVNELRTFMKEFIEIHGQNDNQNLLDNKLHLQYLDGFIGEKIESNLNKYYILYEKYNKIKSELKANYGDEKEKQRKLDLLKYQFDEIEKAELKTEEEYELEEKRKIVMNSEKISQNLQEAEGLIADNGIDSISMAIRALEKIENIDEKYEKVSANLKNIYYELQELTRDIENYNSDIYFDEEERNYIEERLDLIHSLKRKYGNTISEILKYSSKVEEEIHKIENLDEYHKKIKAKINVLKQELLEIANNMTNTRKKYAKELSIKINKELKDLEMPNARFEIQVDTADKFYETGIDEVEFMICTNIGEELKPLVKIASGGEMARIMLAIKNVLADVDEVSTLVFDEIDTGISGKASKAVAEKMKSIAKSHQVICITHLPSIAAKGDHNYYISKQTKENKTYTQIKKLSEEETIEEIARISSGEVTEIAKAHAQELRKAS